jgi:hypothetical protein
VRGREQILGILQSWPDGFQHKFGRKIKKSEFVAYLRDLRSRRELESIKGQFETFLPPEIDLLLQCLEERDFEHIDSGQKKKQKKER